MNRLVRSRYASYSDPNVSTSASSSFETRLRTASVIGTRSPSRLIQLAKRTPHSQESYEETGIKRVPHETVEAVFHKRVVRVDSHVDRKEAAERENGRPADKEADKNQNEGQEPGDAWGPREATRRRLTARSPQRWRAKADGAYPGRGFALTLGGELVRNFGIAATGAFTRNWAARPAGRTDLAVISLSPYWSLPDLHLTVTPRVSYSRNLSDTGTVDNHSEQYQLCLGWNPTWGHSFLSFQGSAEYDRNADAVTLLPVTSSHRYTLSLVLRWGGGSGTLNDPYTGAVGTQPYMPPLQGLGGNGQRI